MHIARARRRGSLVKLRGLTRIKFLRSARLCWLNATRGRGKKRSPAAGVVDSSSSVAGEGEGVGTVHIKKGGVTLLRPLWHGTDARDVLDDAVTRWHLSGPFGRRQAIVIAAVQRVGFICRVAVNSVCTRLWYRAISRHCDNRRVAASAIDIAILPNR